MSAGPFSNLCSIRVPSAFRVPIRVPSVFHPCSLPVPSVFIATKGSTKGGRQKAAPPAASTKGGRPSAAPPLWNPLWLCSYVAMWLCCYVAMWLCGYVALWLCGLAGWLFNCLLGGEAVWTIIASLGVRRLLPNCLNCLAVINCRTSMKSRKHP